ETNVNDGTMTSSPGPIESRSAAISSAWVQEVVRSALATPSVCSRRAWHLFVNGPSPDRCPRATASAMYRCSSPTNDGRLNGMRFEFNGSLHPHQREGNTCDKTGASTQI